MMRTTGEGPRPAETSGASGYYAVIFTSTRRVVEDEAAYAAMSAKMEELAEGQAGYLGIESTRGPDGLGITVSYWETLEAVRAWGERSEHLVAQRLGRDRWYERFTVRVARVERETVFERGGSRDDAG